MRVSELQYDLASERIAQQPAEPRDSSRLLVVDRASGELRRRIFREIGAELRPGDCLVLNDTRVVPARFYCRRAMGGRIEAFFLRAGEPAWRVLLSPSARLSAGETLAIESRADVRLEIVERHARGEWSVVPRPAVGWLDLLESVGQTPLPPYIRRDAAPTRADRERYQTVYAASPGAVAAPTAGLHFTPRLLDELAMAGVRHVCVTLHVGLGTFAPIDVDDLSQHAMHAEWFAVDSAVLDVLRGVRARGGRIIPVGTTSARVLESIDLQAQGPRSGWTRLLIYPPYDWRNVDALVTNFHLPGSTLLALVMALAGVERIRAAYSAAIAEEFRFYSYGDAMLIV